MKDANSISKKIRETCYFNYQTTKQIVTIPLCLLLCPYYLSPNAHFSGDYLFEKSARRHVSQEEIAQRTGTKM